MEIFRLLGALAAVIFIFYLAWLVPRVIAKRHRLGPLSGRELQVTEKVQLGKDSWLVIVRAGDRRMLLGVAPGGIARLDDLPPLPAGRETGEPEPRPFSEIFRESIAESLPRGRIRDAFDRTLGHTTHDGETTRKESR